MSRPRPAAQHGFTLTEILVGMVIGLLTILAIMQVMNVFEGQKRTTSGSNDAQTNGSIALYTIQRVLQSSGFDLPSYSSNYHPYDCNPEPTFTNNGITVGFFPISITDGGTGPGASDSIIVRGNLLPPTTASQTGQAYAGIPTIIQSAAGTTVNVSNNMGCATSTNTGTDLALTIQSSLTYDTSATCSTNLYTVVTGYDPVNAPTVTGAVTLGGIPVYTNGNPVQNGDGLICLKNWSQLTYSIDTTVAGGALAESVSTISSGQVVNKVNTIAPDIIMLRAQYGLSDPANTSSNAIVNWVSATGIWATPSAANRKLIKAVHVAVIARSGQYEKSIVSTPCSSLTDANPTGVCAWAGATTTGAAPQIDLSNDPNWQHYRYRVFETVIPVRNTILGMTTL
jgi:type IV pilus assembly protein PilW